MEPKELRQLADKLADQCYDNIMDVTDENDVKNDEFVLFALVVKRLLQLAPLN